MFWRQNAAQQQEQHPQQQQQQQQQEQPKRLSFSFNVKIAVNVNTKMCNTHISPECAKHQHSYSPSCRSRSNSGSRGLVHRQTRHLAGWREQLAQLGRQLTPSSARSGSGGISTILIVNLLLLLLLSLCCDVCCRSHAEQQQPLEQQQQQSLPELNYGAQAALRLPPPILPEPFLRPTLDSDVVEKVAVWTKHLGASPPSVAEGIAISSIARSNYNNNNNNNYYHKQQQLNADANANAKADMKANANTNTNTNIKTDADVGIEERIVLERVTRDCVQRCIVEEDLFLDEFGIKCEKADNSDKCYKTRCTKGCAQWYRALKEIEPCQEACASTQFYPFDLPCIGACEMAQRDYWHLQRLAMTQLVEKTQPQLAEIQGESSTLTIKWSIQFPENYLASRPFNIQYQHVDFPDEEATSWHNLADYDCDEYYVCEILEALVPYTRYKFRFELPFGDSSDDVIYSPATPIYLAPIAGAPISAPILEALLALDDTHVAIHWQPGLFSNAPLEGYRLVLSSSKNFSREQLLPAQRKSCIFAQLEPQTNYTLALSMINKQGEGPATVASIETKASLEPEQLPSVLLVGQRSIIWQSLESGGETRLIFRYQHTSINDVVWSEHIQRFWLVDSTGDLYSQSLEETKTVREVSLHFSAPDGNSKKWLPRRLCLDWLKLRLFLAAERQDSQGYSLLSSDLEGNDARVEVKSLDQAIHQIELDALNGWLFWSDGESLRRMDVYTKERIRLCPFQGYFMLEPQRWLLHVLRQVEEEQQLVELSYDGSHRSTQYLPNFSWQSFALSTDQRQLLLANATELQLLEPSRSWPREQHSESQEKLLRLIPLERRRQPQALDVGMPLHLEALLGAQAAHISWQPPQINPYQSAMSAARNCSYELEVLDVASHSGYNIRNIRSPLFGLERLQPDNRYQLRVRALNAAGTPGPWTKAINVRSWPRGEHRLRWAAQRGQLFTTNELGEDVQVLSAKLSPSPGPLSVLNESLAYYVSGAVLRCVNLHQPQLSCPVASSDHVGSLAYEWRGGLLYWTDLSRNCVQRFDPVTGARELLPLFGARQLALDSDQGHIYYATDAHLARRPLNALQPEVEFYQLNGLTGHISGFCLDLQQRRLYWLVSAHSELHLYRASLTLGASSLELLVTLPASDALPQSLQLLEPLNALLWLAADAHTGQLLRLDTELQVQHIKLKLSAALSTVQIVKPPPPGPDFDVLPMAVPLESVRIDAGGHWDDFRLRWQPASSGGNHSISYKLLLEHGSERVLTVQLATPFARITQLAQAPLELRVSITPHTVWRAGPTTRVQLATPMAAPSQPRRLRVYIERQAAALQMAPNISALLRWDVPEEQAGSAVPQFRVSSWHGTELHAELLLNQSTLEARIEQLKADESYRFEVQAGNGAGTATSVTLHVSPEVQSVPRLLYSNAEHIGELDLDTSQRRQLVHTASPVEHLALLQGEQRLLWVNEHVELLSHVPGAPPAKLARMRAEVLALSVDWVQRVVYWAELDAATQPPAAIIYRLDLCSFDGKILQGERMWRTPPGQLLRDLVALPHARALIWLQHNQDERNATLQGRNLTSDSNLSFESVPGGIWRLFEGSQQPQAETVNLVDHLGRLCVYHVARQLCMSNALRAQLNMLRDDIAQIAQDAGYVYALRNGSVRAYGRRRQQLEFLLELQPQEVRLLRAYNYQAYPARHCLLLPHTLSEGALKPAQCEETYCSIQLPELSAAPDCSLAVPGLIYQLNLTTSQSSDLRQYVRPAGQVLNITGLQPFHGYALHMRLKSFYQQRLRLPQQQLLHPLEMRTAFGTPSAPRNFSARALSPHEIELIWWKPLQLRSDSIYYTLHWILEPELGEEEQSEQEQRVETAGVKRLTGLQPGRLYTLWLHAHSTPSKFNSSGRQHVRSYAPVPPLQLLEVNAYTLTLAWAGTPDALSTLTLECQSLRDQLQLEILGGNYSMIVVEPLQPKTLYSCRLGMSYASSPGSPIYYTASQDYETLGDAPGAPGRPQLEHIADEIFRVSWTHAAEHGAPILLYQLQALQARRSTHRRRRRESTLTLLPWAEEPQAIEDQWLDFCNTTELSCIVRELHTRRLLLFRVRARNRAYGWGPFSEDSERIEEPFVSTEKRGSLVVAIIAPAAIVSTCVLVLVVVRKLQKRSQRAKKLLQQSRPSIWSNLSALQTQQQLLAARSRTFSMTLSDADIALLPQISWNRLTLLRFLGSGAFGEVYEGQLHPPVEDNGVGEEEGQRERLGESPSQKLQRVAIKSLRKGASEFAELLQEAQLMSNFKHENIVCLIGICCDSESISLIMEHMEAGDLLSYLRAARPSSSEAQPTLNLRDLLAMCLDVANGCSYLEEMHFVHRDLACRNCLVSEGAAIGGRRIVKIGDFGLARDIYKSDYYRKEGEGLLPVRWMAPESLVDGLFSTQSDVWAFGVLCWEILTLGQQPYAARNNFEVLAHVKEGGRLQTPEHCPEKLYGLLLQCWRTEPWERPSFKRCFNTLQAISSQLTADDSCGFGSGSSSTSSSDSGSSQKPELRVRFNEAPERLALQSETKDMPNNGNNIMASSSNSNNNNNTKNTNNSNLTTASDNYQLYENEGISRL